MSSGNENANVSTFDGACRSLAEVDYFIWNNFISPDELNAIVQAFEARLERREFQNSKVRKLEEGSVNQSVRRDLISWLEPASYVEGEAILFKILENLKTELNRQLYLGLWAVEGHFALYEPGAFYIRHFDRFQDQDSRVISVVLYLNETWKTGDGGELSIFRGDENVATVAPVACRLVVFSSHLEHEVLPSQISRRSFVAWFKRRL